MSLAQVSRLDWRRHHRKMEPQGNGKQTREKTLERIGEHAYSSGLDLETKIFSASGRGGAFFLTSLFIELIDSPYNPSCISFCWWFMAISALQSRETGQ